MTADDVVKAARAMLRRGRGCLYCVNGTLMTGNTQHAADCEWEALRAALRAHDERGVGKAEEPIPHDWTGTTTVQPWCLKCGAKYSPVSLFCNGAHATKRHDSPRAEGGG